MEAAGRPREGGDDHVPVPRHPSSTDASLGYAARLRISRRDSATDQAGPLQNKTECSGSTQSKRKSVGSLSTHSTQCILTAMGKSSAVSAASQRFSSITRPIDGGGSISHAIVLRTGQLPLRLTKLCASPALHATAGVSCCYITNEYEQIGIQSPQVYLLIGIQSQSKPNSHKQNIVKQVGLTYSYNDIAHKHIPWPLNVLGH